MKRDLAMIKRWNITIPELTGSVPRKAYIYVPDAAKRDPEARFPVLYMFDGHNVFYDRDATYGKSWGMADYVRRTKLPMIIAAVECNHSPDGGRLREYAPFTFTCDELGRIQGRGRTTMQWLIRSFKPFIDANFPTLPDREHTFIAGSSMGGLMSLYAVTNYNRVFSRAAALSPSVWFGEEKLEKMLRSHPMGEDTVVYMDYGSREMDFHPGMKDHFYAVAAILAERNVHLTTRIVPQGDHNEATWEKQLPIFMHTLLYGVE